MSFAFDECSPILGDEFEDIGGAGFGAVSSSHTYCKCIDA